MSRNERQPFQLSPARTQTQTLKLNTTTPALSSSDPVNGWGPELAWPVTCPQSKGQSPVQNRSLDLESFFPPQARSLPPPKAPSTGHGASKADGQNGAAGQLAVATESGWPYVRVLGRPLGLTSLEGKTDPAFLQQGPKSGVCAACFRGCGRNLRCSSC